MTTSHSFIRHMYDCMESGRLDEGIAFGDGGLLSACAGILGFSRGHVGWLADTTVDTQSERFK